MEPKDKWAGEFGDNYHIRNWVDWQKRVPFFRHVLELTGARSVLEFGCGPGWNLSACRRACPDTAVKGVEINGPAGVAAADASLLVKASMEYIGHAELVFTTGCLIHIPPADIEETMKSLIDKSYKYVMSIEYENPRPLEIEYRGEMGLLWKRPYMTK
jgi:spore coat polysaccharide biosynthesis protein SpsF